MKKRSLLFVLFMQIITLGIYHLYWLYKTRKEMVSRGAQGTWPFSVLGAPILILIALLGSMTVSFVIGQLQRAGQTESSSFSSTLESGDAYVDSPIVDEEFVQNDPAEGQSFENGYSPASAIINTLLSILVTAAVIVTLPVMIFWHYKYSKAVEFVTQGKIKLGFSFGMFLLFWLLGIGFVWPMIIQDAFNDIADANTGHPGGPQPLQPPYTIGRQSPPNPGGQPQPPASLPPSPGPIA